VFASAYLRNRLAYVAPTEDIEIHPNAVVDVNGQQVEVDVYLPQFSIVLECKVFEDSLAAQMLDKLSDGISQKVSEKLDKMVKSALKSQAPASAEGSQPSEQVGGEGS